MGEDRGKGLGWAYSQHLSLELHGLVDFRAAVRPLVAGMSAHQNALSGTPSDRAIIFFFSSSKPDVS